MSTTSKKNDAIHFATYPKIDNTKLKAAVKILRSMNHQLRQTILVYLDKKGSSNVTDLYNALDIEQSVASQHLAIMRLERIVKTNRVGKQINYSVNHERIDFLMKKVNEII